jgi:hypothetical protein
VLWAVAVLKAGLEEIFAIVPDKMDTLCMY